MYLQDNKETLYQWEINQKVIVENEFVKEVHFSNATTPKALVVDVKDGMADVPNILLQTDFDIKAFGYCGQSVRECFVINVIGRAKPDDYVYTETEVRSWEELANKVEETAEKAEETLVKAEETLAKVEEIIEGNNNLVIDGEGRATINANELYLGNRDVLREAGFVEESINLTDEGVATWLDAGDYAEIGKNYIHNFYGEAQINISGKVHAKGKVEFNGMIPSKASITMHYDTNETETINFVWNDENSQIHSFKFTKEGVAYITVKIEGGAKVTFETLAEVKGYINGIMSAEDKQNLDNLKTQMGDIDTALDVIIAIQNSLIGGEN